MATLSEEVLFKYPTHPAIGGGWGNVSLFMYDNGEVSLHCQTGEHHHRCIEIATELLKWRGLVVGKAVLLGPSGLYYTVASAVRVEV